MLAFETNKLAMLGGDRLLDMTCIRTATDLKYRKSEEENKKKESRVQREIYNLQSTSGGGHVFEEEGFCFYEFWRLGPTRLCHTIDKAG